MTNNIIASIIIQALQRIRLPKPKIICTKFEPKKSFPLCLSLKIIMANKKRGISPVTVLQNMCSNNFSFIFFIDNGVYFQNDTNVLRLCEVWDFVTDIYLLNDNLYKCQYFS